MSRKIRLKRGALKDLPQLELGEPGVATDEGTMFIGTDRGNIRLANQEDLDGVSQQLADTKRNVGSIENFGGIVDGLTDNSTAFSTAFNSSDAVYIFLPPGKTLTSQLTIPANKNVVIEGAGKDVSELHCTGRFFVTTNPEKSTTTVASGILKGAKVITVASSEGFRKGQLITFTSTENMEETARAPVRKTHSAIITKVETGSITIDRGFPISFSIEGFTVTAKGYDVGSIRFANMTVSGEYDGYFADVMNAKDFQTENVKLVNRHKGYQGETSTGGFNPSGTGGSMHGFRVQYSVDSKFINPEFEYLSYGIMPTLGAVGVSIKNPKASRCRHTAAPTGGSQNVTVESGNAYECFAGFDSHETAYDTTHINCRSYGDEIAVKLRGRVDKVIDCEFDGGLNMRHDTALRGLPDREGFRKSFSNSTFSRGLDVAGSINVSGKDFYVKGLLQNFGVVDTLDLSEGTVVIESFDQGVDGSGSPIDYSLWLNVCKKTVINNVRLHGPYKQQPQTEDVASPRGFKAVRIDRNDYGGTVKMSNVVIDGFDYGMHFIAAMNLEGFVFEDVQIKNCVRGINNAANFKENPTFKRISFEGCAVDIHEPHRFRYTTRPSKPIKGQKYWDQTLKKDITFDGTNWLDAMGNVV